MTRPPLALPPLPPPAAWLLAVVVACLGVAPAGRGQGEPGGTGFGRWNAAVKQCQMLLARRAAPLRDCIDLQLEQQQAGLLSVRLLAASSGGADAAGSGGQRPQSEAVVFAGLLEAGQQPMRCGRDGRCEPRLPLRLQVSMVAQASYDALGLAIGVPQAGLAKGHCQILNGLAHCEASNENGERWLAEAQF